MCEVTATLIPEFDSRLNKRPLSRRTVSNSRTSKGATCPHLASLEPCPQIKINGPKGFGEKGDPLLDTWLGLELKYSENKSETLSVFTLGNTKLSGNRMAPPTGPISESVIKLGNAG